MSRELRPADALGVQRVIGDEAAADLGAALVANGDAVAARKDALDSRDPAGKRLLPPASAAAAPASTNTAPLSSSEPPIQILRAAIGFDGVRNHVHRPPSATRAMGCSTRPSAMTMCAPAAVAIRAASILVRMPPRDSSDAAAARHRLDLRRHALDNGKEPRVGVVGRRGVVEAGDVGQQDQQVRARHGGDARGEPVVVAIADLAGGDRVVLVDDRNRAHRHEATQRRAGVEISTPLLGVLQGQEHLAGDDRMFLQRPRPFARQARSARPRRTPGCPRASSAPFGRPAMVRPSAIAPDDTTSTLAPPAMQPCDIG